jgi:hypothetical protein
MIIAEMYGLDKVVQTPVVVVFGPANEQKVINELKMDNV